jgi:hypothetical protein
VPIHDVECKKCKKIEEVLTLRIGEKILDCECGGKRKKLTPSGKSPSFKLIYNNKTDLVDWDGNRSKYWDSYKSIPKNKRKDYKLPGE